MYRIMICDDIPAHAQALFSMTEQLLPEGVELMGQCVSVDELRACIDEKDYPDILLMDIELDGTSGIETVKTLVPEGRIMQIIYVTGYSKYCTQVYETEHIGFLLKPVKEDELLLALMRAKVQLDAQYAHVVMLQDQKNLYTIPFHKILWIESQAHKVIVWTNNRSFTSYGKLSRLLEDLDGRFFQCHKSYVVNLDQVKDLDRTEFVLKTQKRIPISVRLRGQAYDAFLRHMQRKLRAFP